MSGITVADGQDIIDTKMAPLVKELNIRVEETSATGAVLRMPYGDYLARHGGVISGQSMLAFADSAMVVVIASAIGGYRNMATVDMTTSFMNAARNTDLIGRGEIVKAGKRMVFGQFRLEDAATGEPVANIWTTWMLL
ncbi:MAG: PaaI family thioesterase [Alphaproteobacteria bacterium]|nr:PaaI family thioesterase [Alphaproteobacteria bacterium]